MSLICHLRHGKNQNNINIHEIYLQLCVFYIRKWIYFNSQKIVETKFQKYNSR